MNAAIFAAVDTLTEMELEFPNLFGGTVITYRRGFNLFGKLTIYWYGVLIALGVILAYLYMMRRATRDFGLVKDRVFDVTFVTIIGAFLCARIYYCVFTTLDPDNPMKYTFVTTFTTIRDGGIAMYGGIIGAVGIGYLMCRLRKVHYTAMLDLVAPGFLIGQTIGRWGNFINQEAYGSECSGKWLFAMSGNVIRSEMPAGAFVHPCFLYESVWCLLGFLFLHFYSKKLRTFDGEIALLYAAWYGFGRSFIEQLRTDSLMAGPFKVSQLVGIVSCVAAMVCFVLCKFNAKKTGKPLYVNSDASKRLIAYDLTQSLEKQKKKEKVAPSILADDDADDITDAPEDNSEENRDEDTEKNSDEKTVENSEEKSVENSEEKSDEKSVEKSVENPVEISAENPGENTAGNDSKKTAGKDAEPALKAGKASGKKGKKQSVKASEKPEDKSGENSSGNSADPEANSDENTGGKTDNVPDEKSEERPGGNDAEKESENGGENN